MKANDDGTFHRRRVSFRQWQLVISPVWGCQFNIHGTPSYPERYSIQSGDPRSSALFPAYRKRLWKYITYTFHSRSIITSSLTPQPHSSPSPSLVSFLIPLITHILCNVQPAPISASDQSPTPSSSFTLYRRVSCP